jgi:hypothetical protein
VVPASLGPSPRLPKQREVLLQEGNGGILGRQWIAGTQCDAGAARFDREAEVGGLRIKVEADGTVSRLNDCSRGELDPDALHPRHVREHQSTRFSEFVVGHGCVRWGS